MKRMLFVCTANRYRSAIAEACFKEELRKRGMQESWQVQSSGTWTTNGLPAIPDAIRRAGLLGFDISNHRSTVITGDQIKEADLVLVMDAGHKEALQVEFPQFHKKIFLLSEASKGIAYDIPDPMSGADPNDVVGEIQILIETGFEMICDLAGNCSGP